MARARVLVCELPAVLVGFHGLVGDPPAGTLEWLFLEPAFIGKGLGRQLWRHAIRTAREEGFAELMLESDRFAEPFYLAMGAQRVGSVKSPVDAGELPILPVSVSPTGPRGR